MSAPTPGAPLLAGTNGGQPSSVEALASLLGLPLNSAGGSQPGDDDKTQALMQLLQLVQQQQHAQRAVAPAPQPADFEPVWQQQQQAWQPQAPAPAPHEALLAALLQSAQQQQQQQEEEQQQQPAPLQYQQPAPQQGNFDPLLLGQLGQQQTAPQQALAVHPLPAFQPQEGHSQPSGRGGAADGVAAGRKVRVSCNDVPGVLHIDSLYVACECRDCEARVRLGHDRPIFGLSRWERHCGSKAKKWRISLRVVPGTCPEVKLSDPPMAVGTWLDMKGIHVTGTGERIGVDTEAPVAGIAAKRARLPSWCEGSHEQAGEFDHGHTPRGAGAATVVNAGQAQEAWELALLDGSPPGSSISEAFLRQQQQLFADLRASSSDGSIAQRQHAAIFGLAAALLEGPAQHLLSDAYLPYINDLSEEHLARQTSTFGCYLDLLSQGMDWQAVWRQLIAFMRGTLRRILSKRAQADKPTDDGGDGAAAEEPKPTASSPARPTTAPNAAVPDQERGLPASASMPGMAEAAAYAGEQAPVGSSSRGTGSVGKGAGVEQQSGAPDVKQEPEAAAAGGQAAAGGPGWYEAHADGVGAGGATPAQAPATAGEHVRGAAEEPAAAAPVAAAGSPATEAAGSSGPAAGA